MKKVPNRPPANSFNSTHSFKTFYNADGTVTEYRQADQKGRWDSTEPWEVKVGKKWWQFWKSGWKDTRENL